MHRRSFLAAAAAALAVSNFIPALSIAAEPNPGQFHSDLYGPNLRLKLVGTGLYYYKVFIKVAAAALYLDDRAPRADVLSDIAKRLEMQYYRGIQAKDLVAGSASLLALNLTPEKLARLQPQIEQMHALYQIVAPGDRSALMYVPEVGTSLVLNGTTLGTVPGPEFASAYFSIWFGDRPMDAGLKRKLLGG